MVEFTINVKIDPSRAKTGSKAVRKELDRTEKKANALGGALRRALAVIGAGVLIRNATKTLASFSQEMSTVGAIAQATGAEFATLEEKAISLGTNTRFSATQAAEGMTFLARAGFNTGQVLGTIEGTLQLAQAGALGLGEAADITSNVLKGMRLEVSDTAEVVDVLAFAANNSNTTVSQLGQALKFVAPIAAGLGVSVQDTTAAIATLSDAGLQASTAGTGLRTILARLEQGGPALQAALAGTGVSIDDVKVSSVGLTTALENIGRAGIDTGTALQVFGQRGGPAFEVLRTAGPDVAKFSEKLDEAGGTAKRVADAMDDNLNGAILATKSAFEGLILRLGQNGAQGALRGFFDTLASVLRGAADNIDDFIRALEGLAFVLATTLARKAIPAVIAQLKALGIAIATNPIGALATALTLAVGAAIAFREELTLTEDSATTLGDVLGAMFDQAKKLFDDLSPLISSLADTINDTLGGAFDGFKLDLQTVLLGIGVFVDTALGILLGFGNSAVALFSGIGPAIGSGFFVIVNGVINLIEGATDRTRAFFNAVGTTAKILGGQMVLFFSELNLALSQLAQGNIEAAASQAQQASDQLKNQLAGIGSTFSSSFTAELRQLEGTRLLDELGNPFKGKGEELGKDLSDGFMEGLEFSGATDFILASLDTANAQRAQADAAANLAAAQAAANEAVTAGLPPLEDLSEKTEMAAVSTEVLNRSMGEGLRDGLRSAVQGITDVGGAAETLLVNGFGNAEDALVDFITTGEADFGAFVDSLISDIARLLVKQALLGVIGGAGAPGGGAGLLGSLFGGARASGGPVNPNQAFLVGEEGPELFVPPGAGNIKTASQTAGAAGGQGAPAAAAPAPVNVTVVNSSSPEDTINAMGSAQGTQLIMNAITQNATVLKNALQ